MSRRDHHQDGTEAAGGSRPIDIHAGRRAFIRSVGLGAAGAAVLAGGTFAPDAVEAAPSDVNILNFALNLEYLEAEFYLRAAFGRGLDRSDTTGKGQRGGVQGGREVEFESAEIRQYAREIARDEEAHVKFLRAALGSEKVARPKLDLGDSFTTAARAAGLVANDEEFDAYANENNFLLAAFIFEDVGVTAYKGAARLISNKDFLEAAAGLLAVEAYHAGEIRTLLFGRGLIEQANRISNARDSLDGPGKLDQGIRRDGKANIVPADENGLAFSRTPQQVRDIVYLGGQQNDFGFFPEKLNSTFA